MTNQRILRWLPWLVAAGLLDTFPVVVGWFGVVLLTGWAFILLGYRAAVSLATTRAGRLLIDGLFAALCLVAAFEGGWYLLPAVGLFALGDALGVPAASPPRWHGPAAESVAGIAAAVLGWTMLLVFLTGPLYTTQTATIGPNGAIASPPSTVSLVEVGLEPRAGLVLVLAAVLFGFVLAGAIVHARTARREARAAVGLATIALAILAVLGAFTVGLWLMPGIGLAVLAWMLGGRPGSPAGPTGANR